MNVPGSGLSEIFSSCKQWSCRLSEIISACKQYFRIVWLELPWLVIFLESFRGFAHLAVDLAFRLGTGTEFRDHIRSLLIRPPDIVKTILLKCSLELSSVGRAEEDLVTGPREDILTR